MKGEETNMQMIELYDKVQKPLALADAALNANWEQFEIDVIVEEFRQRFVHSMLLELPAQAKTSLEYYTAYTLKKSIPYPWLSKEEERALREIFPTAYKRKLTPEEHRRGFRRLETYAYDLIPLAVLQTWTAARHTFSEFEIWTAEKREQPDPVLVARHQRHSFVYALARWGDPLRPLDQLAKETATNNVRQIVWKGERP